MTQPIITSPTCRGCLYDTGKDHSHCTTCKVIKFFDHPSNYVKKETS